MTSTVQPPSSLQPPASEVTSTEGTGRLGDRVFRALAIAAAGVLLTAMVGIAVFLVVEAVPSLRENTANFFTEKTFFGNADPPVFGIAALVFGTIVSSIIALVVAVPVALGVALFISHYAPKRVATTLGLIIDLLAAVPSVVYGLWGLIFLNGQVVGLSMWLHKWFGWIPIFSSDGPYGRSYLLAGLVLAIMILPIIAAISREVFLQAPRIHAEAAMALGATRWEVIRLAVLPYGKPGIVSACMLGLGRALGETIAVALVLSANFEISRQILQLGGNTIAANIVLTFPEAGDIGRGALIASGLVLFVLTLAVNFTARAIIARRAAFTGSD